MMKIIEFTAPHSRWHYWMAADALDDKPKTITAFVRMTYSHNDSSDLGTILLTLIIPSIWPISFNNASSTLAFTSTKV
jgi:hypothetical protein